MKRFTATAAATLVGVGAFAQGITALYAPGRQIKDQNISVRGWGSGTIAETDETAFQGAFSLRVSTRNFFQGGLVLFGSPVDLTDRYTNASNMLRLTYKVQDAGMTMGPGAGLGGPAGGGKPKGGPGFAGTGGGGGVSGPPTGGQGGPGGGPPAGFGPGGPPPGLGGPGRPGGGMQGQAAPSMIRNLRMVVTTTDGKKSEAYVSVTSSGSGERGWRTVAVPLQRIAGFDRTNKQIRSIALSADSTGTFYVGDITVLTDTTPLSGEPNVRNLNLALGDEFEFIANGFGGSSILRYTWDFDSRDGIQEDAEGQTVRRKFRKPGDYTITMTVHDQFGLKKPYSTTVSVRVNP